VFGVVAAFAAFDWSRVDTSDRGHRSAASADDTAV